MTKAITPANITATVAPTIPAIKPVLLFPKPDVSSGVVLFVSIKFKETHVITARAIFFYFCVCDFSKKTIYVDYHRTST